MTDLKRLQKTLDRMKIRHDVLPGEYKDNFAKKLFLLDQVEIEFLFNEKTEELVKPKVGHS